MVDENTSLPIIVKLKYPVEFGREVVTQLTAERRLRIGDMKGMKPGELTTDDQMMIAARWFGVNTRVVEGLDMDDWAEVQRAMVPFFAAFRETGQ